MPSLHQISGPIVVLLASVAWTPAQALGAGGINMKPGVWEISTAIESSDSVSRRNVTSRVCYSSDDVKALTQVLPPQRGVSMKCLAQDVKSIDASSGTWKLACKGKEATFSGIASIKAQGTSYTSQADLESKSGSKSVHVSEKTSAHWVEPCR